jgi:glycosyltransferase involved in cell wall biosynthesis
MTFVFLSITDWDAPQFGSRQQIAQELSARGHRVLFVDIPRAVHSLISDPSGTKQALSRMGKLRWVNDQLAVYTPRPVLPIYYHPVTNWINQRLLVSDVRRGLQMAGWQPDVVWTFWANTAVFLQAFQKRFNTTSVYHCIDDFTAVSYPFVTSQTIAAMEREQSEFADFVFARTRRLANRLQAFNSQTTWLPGGVDTKRFAPAQVTADSEINQLPHPIAGFVGTLDHRVDVALLQKSAQALPEVSFALIGPVKQHQIELDRLSALPNVHLFPPCPAEKTPAKMAAFDVGLIPYKINNYTKGLSPIKLYEYLAMEKPIVSTALPYVMRESAHVQLAETAVSFTEAVKTAVSTPPSPSQKQAWRQVALDNAWSKQVDIIEAFIGS